MEIDGTYNIELLTTIGKEAITLTLETDGNSLSGSMDGYFGQQSFTGGTVNENNVSWSAGIQSPMGEMKLEVNGTINGDDISGQLQLGAFRPTEFKGTRA